jgi:DNA-binding transcriptional MerR regulator
MQIGEVGERTGLSITTLRHYDEAGLVEPSSRSAGGFRLYSEADIERLLVIRRMKPLGFTVEEMRDLLHTVEGLSRAADGQERERLAAHIREFVEMAQQRRAKLWRQLGMADEFIAMLQQRVGD